MWHYIQIVSRNLRRKRRHLWVEILVPEVARNPPLYSGNGKLTMNIVKMLVDETIMNKLEKISWKHSVENEGFYWHTMLQKLSKCEVKAAWYGYFSNLLPLRFYVKSNFDVIKHSKNAIFANFRGAELLFLVNLSNFATPNLLNFKVLSL